MPELPEVLTITKDLNKHLKGAVIDNVTITEKYKVFPDNSTFIDSIKGNILSNR